MHHVSHTAIIKTIKKNSDNSALSHGFLSVPIRNRHLCELCLIGVTHARENWTRNLHRIM